jgi:hypothetical protein
MSNKVVLNVPTQWRLVRGGSGAAPSQKFIKKIRKIYSFKCVNFWCKETIDFINVIGDRLIAESGDSKSKKFLFERISLAIQRGNAASIRGTFPDSALLSEIFAL